MQFNQAPSPRESSLGDAYDPTASYSVDDLCIHDNVLYKCIVPISGGEAWNSEHWTETNVVDEIIAANSKIATVQENANYYTLINQIALTAQYTTHSLYNGRKFSDYDLIVITPVMNGWARVSSEISRNTFTQITGADARFYQGTDLIEVDVKYKSDTEIECKYIGNASSTIYLFVYGLFKRY